MIGWLRNLFRKKEPPPDLFDDDDFPAEKTTVRMNTAQLYMANSDIIKGFEFNAALDFSTPLKTLKMHGQRVPMPKTEEEFNKLGIGNPFDPELRGGWTAWLGDTSIEGTQATTFGPMTPSNIKRDLLPFLISYRMIVESSEPPHIIHQLLCALPQQRVEWQRLINGRLVRGASLGDYWAAHNLMQIKGIGPAKAKKIIERGIYTAKDYENSKLSMKSKQ